MTYANWTTRLLPPNAQEGEASGGGGAGQPAAQPAPAEGEPPSLVGSRVGPYLITKRLGEGGVGAVYKGVDEMLKREVAVKVLHREYASDPLFVARFSREAQLHAKLSHPNVATVHAFLHEGDTQFMVMEYVPGISLDEFVRAGGPVPLERALGIFRRALDGIAHAHRSGIVHRDIKPANIMLADSGAVKVMDFGIARALDNHEQLTRHGQVAGTAKAMAPEQIRGGEADVRSDIYSLGIVLFTMLAGRAPFDAESDFALMKAQLEQAPPSLRALAPEVPPEVEAAVMKALQKDPAARFQTVADFARALDAWQVTDATAALPPSRPRPAGVTMARTAVNPALAAGAQGAGAAPAAAPGAAAAQEGSAAHAARSAGDRARAGATMSATAAFAAMPPAPGPTTEPAPSGGGAAAAAAAAAFRGFSAEADPDFGRNPGSSAPSPRPGARRGAARRWQPLKHRLAVGVAFGVAALGAAGFFFGPALLDSMMPAALPPLPAGVLQHNVGKGPRPADVAPPAAAAAPPAVHAQVQPDAAPRSFAAAASPAQRPEPKPVAATAAPDPLAAAVERASTAGTAPVNVALAPPAAAAVPPASPLAAVPGPRGLAIVRVGADGQGTPEAAHRFKPGERVRLRVAPSQDAHVYCYMQDEALRVMRFYPNRFSQGARVSAAAPLEIPGPMGFEIVANTRNVPETIACFASERDLMGELPRAVVGTDFEKLPATTLDQVRSAFASAAGDAMAEARFEIRFK